MNLRKLVPTLACSLMISACGTEDTTGGADIGVDAVVPDVGDVSARWIFLTSATTASGGGIAGLDAFCNADEARPDPAATYAALIVGPSRRACTTPLCEGGADALDWPLEPNQTYASAEQVIFTTDANGIVTEDPTGLLIDAGYNFWSGADREWVVLEDKHCNDWTSDSDGEGSLGWTGGPPIPDFFGGHGNWSCDTSVSLVCVEVE